MVTFANLNLSEEFHSLKTCNTQAMDIIFCRNVLMYFSEEWIRIISQNFSQSLQPDGWFVVSSCELSSAVFPYFTPINFPGAVLYRKGKKVPVIDAGTPLVSFAFDVHSEFMSLVPLPPEPSAYEAAPGPDLPSADNFPVSPIPVATKESGTDTDSEAGSTIALQIRMLADQGDLPRALVLCNEGIASNKLDIGLYFLRGSILQELDDTGAAIASVKQAIYLDPDFVMGHFALGNLYARQGNQKNATRYFKNALGLLNACANDEILPESDGLPVKYIREILLVNMNEYSIP
jgi:chemotaxis protein methyltransferase CheR